jgi:hypothetical protein
MLHNEKIISAKYKYFHDVGVTINGVLDWILCVLTT